MALRLEGYVELPEHRGEGGFDHAAVHRGRRRLYVAHTANDALDVIDLDELRHVDSIGGLTGVAGALVAESRDLVFTSSSAPAMGGTSSSCRHPGMTSLPTWSLPAHQT